MSNRMNSGPFLSNAVNNSWKEKGETMDRLNIKTDTIIRTVVLLIALINQGLTSTGHSIIPVTDDQIAEIVTLCITIASSVWAWWKNNSFTQAALFADNIMRRKKNE